MLRKLKRQAKRIAVTAFALTVSAVSSASAAIDWTGVTLDTGAVDSAMGLIVVGLGTLWGFRKVIKTMNRS